ncbi:hypothetical protein ACFL1H_04670, partial [Nanoarchaeota archaeon]
MLNLKNKNSILVSEAVQLYTDYIRQFDEAYNERNFDLANQIETKYDSKIKKLGFDPDILHEELVDFGYNVECITKRIEECINLEKGLVAYRKKNK